jgi:hypothetical protein
MKFKSLLVIGASLGLMAASALNAQGLAEGYITKQGSGTTQAQAIFPAGASKALRLVSYDVKSDLASATLKIYTGTAVSTLVSNALTTATNIYVSAGAGSFAQNDIVVIQNPDDTAFTAVVNAVEGATNIQFTAQLGTAATANGKIYKMATVYTTVAANVAVRESGECLAIGPRRQPMLLRLTGTSACTINWATARYD